MIKQVINIKDYWKIIVYYNVNYNLFNYILKDFKKVHTTKETIERIYDMMRSNKAKAVTLSNIHYHISLVLFNKHPFREDYINSIIHEAEHIKQAMLYAYNVDDKGEPPAYTIGYLAMKLLNLNIMKNVIS